jgi:drug/metabolite transporter (DMT)-like permease
MVHFIPVNNRKAGLIMVLAMLIIGFIDNYIAVIAETASLWQFQIMRAGLALPILLIISAFGLGVLKPIRWWAVYFRSFLTALSMLFYFGSLAFVTFADALAGLFTAPIFVLLISAFFLRQPVGPIRIIAVVIGFLGILLVLGNTANEFSYISLLPAIGGFFLCVWISSDEAVMHGRVDTFYAGCSPYYSSEHRFHCNLLFVYIWT